MLSIRFPGKHLDFENSLWNKALQCCVFPFAYFSGLFLLLEMHHLFLLRTKVQSVHTRYMHSKIQGPFLGQDIIFIKELTNDQKFFLEHASDLWPQTRQDGIGALMRNCLPSFEQFSYLWWFYPDNILTHLNYNTSTLQQHFPTVLHFCAISGNSAQPYHV